jgi:hypothetical protein
LDLSSQGLGPGRGKRAGPSEGWGIALPSERGARSRHLPRSSPKWYLDLTHDEYDYEPENATTYGPFFDEEAAEDYLDDNFSNPGSLDVDDRGTRRPPKRSPNGSPVQKPRRGFRWASETFTYKGDKSDLFDFDGRTYLTEASDLRLRRVPGTIQVQNRVTGDTDLFSNPRPEKNRDNEIVKWVYRGPSGKTLVVVND